MIVNPNVIYNALLSSNDFLTYRYQFLGNIKMIYRPFIFLLSAFLFSTSSQASPLLIPSSAIQQVDFFCGPGWHLEYRRREPNHPPIPWGWRPIPRYPHYYNPYPNNIPDPRPYDPYNNPDPRPYDPYETPVYPKPHRSHWSLSFYG